MILLVEVQDGHGNQVTDHVHFTIAKCWHGMRIGDLVEFSARVTRYWKGYHDNRTMDYRLSHPTDVRCLSRPGAPADNSGQMILL